MAIKTSTNKKQATTIRLEGNLGIAEAEALHVELHQALEHHGNIVLDGENLSQVDASIVQMLCAFIHDIKKDEISLTWKAVPESLKDTASMMGMTEKLYFHE